MRRQGRPGPATGCPALRHPDARADSFTWGFALANKDTYAARLGARARAQRPPNSRWRAIARTRIAAVLEAPISTSSPSSVVYGIIAHHFERNVSALRAVLLRVLPRRVACRPGATMAAGYIAPPLQQWRAPLAGAPDRRLSLPAALADARSRCDLFGRLYGGPGASTANRTMRERRKACGAFSCGAHEPIVTASGAQLLVVFLPTNYCGRPGGKLCSLVSAEESVEVYFPTSISTDTSCATRKGGGPEPLIVGDGHPRSLAGHEDRRTGLPSTCGERSRELRPELS